MATLPRNGCLLILSDYNSSQMRDVAIVGAGALGGALAHLLAQRDIVAAVRLIDESGSVAAGQALDIMQASPVEGFATDVSGSTDVAAAAGASVIIVADRFGAAEWQGEEGLALLRRLVRSGSPSVIVCAGAAQRDLVERGAREMRVPRTLLIGSAPEALAGAVRAIVALETGGSPADVGLTVLGVPPSQIVVPWEEATIGGLAATRMLDQPTRRRISSKIAALWPPGPYALASAAVKAVESVCGKSRQSLSAFVAPDDAAGTRSRAVALPVRLGLTGVVEVLTPVLTTHDRVALDNAMML
jgi:malate dehydrogenase